ncbi:MAG TPA: amidohydrolase family protein [Exilispira sp.]|nr:amidohydrolase family protein [Exilispira sp.]
MKIQYFKNGKFYSMLSQNDTFSYMLAVDGKIVFTSDEPIPLKRFQKKGYEIITYDLDEKVCIPSFCDSHVHFMYPVIHIDDLDLSCETSFIDVINKIKEFYYKIVNSNSTRWILGGGWDKNNWSDKFDDPGFQDLAEFDKVPIILFSKDYHSVWLNENAIRLFDLKNPDKNILSKLSLDEKQYFEGIKKTYDGKFSGIFCENTMRYISYILSIKYQLNEDQILENIKKVINIFNKNGITAITDCSSLYSDSPFRYLQKMPIDSIPIRCSISIAEDALDNFISLGLYTGMGKDQLKIGGLKILYDGSLGSQTGLMLMPYDNSENIGKSNIEMDKLRQLTEKAIKNKIGLSIHAIGDRATLDIANLFEFARNLDSKIPLRMEHAQTLTDEAISKLKYLNIQVVMQPVHIDQDISSANKYLSSRKNLLYRFKSLMNNNIYPSFSTDYPVAPLNPFYGIYCALKHGGFNLSKGETLNPEEAIPCFDAVRAYTFYSHKYSLFEDCGLLTEGYWADFVLLDKDIFNIEDDEEILNIKVLNTFFKGEKVF